MLAVVVHRSDIADYGACDGTFTMELPRCTAAAAAAGDAMGSVYALTCTYVTLLTCVAASNAPNKIKNSGNGNNRPVVMLFSGAATSVVIF